MKSSASKAPQENMMTSEDFQIWLRANGNGEIWEEKLQPDMKRIIINSMLCAQDEMGVRKNSFALYGADFLLTEDFRVWLIEINSSPCMASSTSITAGLTAAVLEDTIKVVLDRKEDRNCDVGRFELIYRQVLPRHPYSLGLELHVNGTKIQPDPPTGLTPQQHLKDCAAPQNQEDLKRKTASTQISISGFSQSQATPSTANRLFTSKKTVKQIPWEAIDQIVKKDEPSNPQLLAKIGEPALQAPCNSDVYLSNLCNIDKNRGQKGNLQCEGSHEDRQHGCIDHFERFLCTQLLNSTKCESRRVGDSIEGREKSKNDPDPTKVDKWKKEIRRKRDEYISHARTQLPSVSFGFVKRHFRQLKSGEKAKMKHTQNEQLKQKRHKTPGRFNLEPLDFPTVRNESQRDKLELCTESRPEEEALNSSYSDGPLRARWRGKSRKVPKPLGPISSKHRMAKKKSSSRSSSEKSKDKFIPYVISPVGSESGEFGSDDEKLLKTAEKLVADSQRMTKLENEALFSSPLLG